jgi:hypothetical protein
MPKTTKSLKTLSKTVCDYQKNILNRKDVNIEYPFDDEAWTHFIKESTDLILSICTLYSEDYDKKFSQFLTMPINPDNYENIAIEAEKLIILVKEISVDLKYLDSGEAITIDHETEIANLSSLFDKKSSLLSVHQICVHSLKNLLQWEKDLLCRKTDHKNYSCVSLNGIKLLYIQFNGESENIYLVGNEDVVNPDKYIDKVRPIMSDLSSKLNVFNDKFKQGFFKKTTISPTNVTFRISKSEVVKFL